MNAAGTEITGRDRMASQARGLVAQVDAGRDDVAPQVVALCRRMVEADARAKRAVEEGLAAISRARAEGRTDDAADHMQRLEEANREMDEAGARLLTLIGR